MSDIEEYPKFNGSEVFYSDKFSYAFIIDATQWSNDELKSIFKKFLELFHIVAYNSKLRRTFKWLMIISGFDDKEICLCDADELEALKIPENRVETFPLTQALTLAVEKIRLLRGPNPSTRVKNHDVFFVVYHPQTYVNDFHVFDTFVKNNFDCVVTVKRIIFNCIRLENCQVPDRVDFDPNRFHLDEVFLDKLKSSTDKKYVDLIRSDGFDDYFTYVYEEFRRAKADPVNVYRLFINEVTSFELVGKRLFYRDYRNDSSFWVNRAKRKYGQMKKGSVEDESEMDVKFGCYTTKKVYRVDGVEIGMSVAEETEMLKHGIDSNLPAKGIYLLYLEAQTEFITTPVVQPLILKPSKSSEKDRIFLETLWQYCHERQLQAVCRFNSKRNAPVILRADYFDGNPVFAMFSVGFVRNYNLISRAIHNPKRIERDIKPDRTVDVFREIVRRLDTGTLPTDVNDPKKQQREAFLRAKKLGRPMEHIVYESTAQFHRVDALLEGVVPLHMHLNPAPKGIGRATKRVKL